MGVPVTLQGFANGAIGDRRFVMESVNPDPAQAYKRVGQANGSRAIVLGITDAAVTDGERFDYATCGTQMVRVGEGGIPPRSFITSDSEGRAVVAGPGDYVKAYFRGGKGFDPATMVELNGPAWVGSYLEVELLPAGFWLDGGEEISVRCFWSIANTDQGSPDAEDVKLLTEQGNPITLPAGAIVRSFDYFVTQPFAPVDGTTVEIAVGASGAGSPTLLSPIAINDASNPFVSGGHGGNQDGSPGSFAQSAGGDVVIRSSALLTAGRLMGVLKYVLPRFP